MLLFLSLINIIFKDDFDWLVFGNGVEVIFILKDELLILS